MRVNLPLWEGGQGGGSSNEFWLILEVTRQPPTSLSPWCLPAFNAIGGYSNLEEAYLKAVPSKIVPNTTCHLPRADAMHLFRDPISGDLPWTGMTFGLSIMATWYWCTDQVNVNKIPLPCVAEHRLQSIQLHPPLLLLLAGGLGGLLLGVGSTWSCRDFVLEVLGLGQFGERDAERCPHLLGCLLALGQGAQGFAHCSGLAGAEGFALPVGLAACNGLFGLGAVPSVLAGPRGFLTRWGAGRLLALLLACEVPGAVAVDVRPLFGTEKKKSKT